jgi:hypothetical protein
MNHRCMEEMSRSCNLLGSKMCQLLVFWNPTHDKAFVGKNVSHIMVMACNVPGVFGVSIIGSK